MRIQIKYTFTLLFIVGLQTVSAQKKDENIGTEVVNVVKPYTPTISDAFKVKETPTLDDEDNTKKEPIKYSIFSFPVASTFTPSKGRAAGVDKAKQEELYKNYVVGGFGNYLTLLGELYVTQDIGDNDYVAGMVKHLSSQGGIKNITAKDDYMNSSIDLTYGSKMKEFSWNADLGYQLQKYYWYGVPLDYGQTLTPDQQNSVYEDVNNGFVYSNFYAGGKLKFNESIFDELTLKYDRFWNDYNSQENRFIVKPSFNFDISETNIKTNLIVDYVGGSFEGNTFPAMKYGFANLGIQPSFAMQKDDWSFNLGASVFYSLDTENSDNKLFVYPKVNASLKVVGDLMVFYLGAEGGLEQNSYRDFSNANPFLTPFMNVVPTDQQYDLFAGLRGKLSNYISYNVKGGVISEKNKALFAHNPFTPGAVAQSPYGYGNAFGIVYDDVKSLNFFGELKADFSKNFSGSVNAEFHQYDTKFNAEAWNLPELKLGAKLDFNITPKWYAGADVFFIGERKDIDWKVSPLAGIKTVDGYFDANAHVGFKFNERFAAFLKVNNMANQNYEKWLYYPVQGVQLMLGGSYKFDF